MRNLFRRAHHGSSWVMVLLMAVAFMIFGNLLLKMFFSIAMGVVALAIQAAVFLFIIFALFYGIRMLSGSKPEKKN